jgi:ribonuclease HI
MSKKKKISLRRREIKSADQIKTMVDLQTFFQIKDWDAIIVTDGSGTVMEKAGGWGSVMIEQGEMVRSLFWGGASHATNNIAELMAVYWPLLALMERKSGLKKGGYQVHVISDSQYVVAGLKKSLEAHKANKSLWAAIQQAKRRGIIICPHFVPRDTLAFNQLCHDLANAARRSMLPERIRGKFKWNEHETTPT